MRESHESLLPLAAMQVSFRQHFRGASRFREDSALLAALEQELDPVLDALYVAFQPSEGPRALHEAYALLSLLCRKAAQLDATPSVALVISDGLVGTLRKAGVSLSSEHASELAIVAVEAYCRERDEHVSQELRATAAAAQVAVWLSPRCMAVFLAGRHEEGDLSPVLERFARALLREDARGLLLDLSRLHLFDDEIARALGRFCGSAATLGVRTIICGASRELRARLGSWLAVGTSPVFEDDYRQAQALALATDGLRIRPVRSWLGLVKPGRSRGVT